MTDAACWICRGKRPREHRGVNVCFRSSCVRILNALVAHYDYFNALNTDVHAADDSTVDAHLEVAALALPDTFHRTPEEEPKPKRDIGAEAMAALENQLEEEHIPLTATLESLTDPLGVVELVLAFEETFLIDIPDAHIGDLKTVGDAIDYVIRRVEEKTA